MLFTWDALDDEEYSRYRNYQSVTIHPAGGYLAAETQSGQHLVFPLPFGPFNVFLWPGLLSRGGREGSML